MTRQTLRSKERAVKKQNPPIKGHELLSEGRQWTSIDIATDDYRVDENGAIVYHGGCRCGAQPDGWPSVSLSAVKRWHREHKADLRSKCRP